jgi:DNA (cytosine-5)-methyltransferase 1
VFVDLFAGCGGLSLGLHQAGWHGLFAVEKNPMAFETLQHNLISRPGYYSWPKWLPQTHHNLNTLLKKHATDLATLAGKVDLVAGGPPCQGFSTAGQRKKGDGRNRLVYAYLSAIELLQPKIVFFENVRGFNLRFTTSSGDSRIYSNEVINHLKDLGYKDAEGRLLDLSVYGVPQRRKRFIIVGTKNGQAAQFFKLLNARRKAYLQAKGIPETATVSQALSDLLRAAGEIACPDFESYRSGKYGKPSTAYQRLMRSGVPVDQVPDSHRFARHRDDVRDVFSRMLEKAPRNQHIDGDEREKYGIKKRSVTVLGPNHSSPTITSIPDDCIHYAEPRILTARECARLQSFPDWFQFRGKYTTGGKLRRKEVPRFTQIGNAVPPLFAELAGNVLKELLANA